MGYNNYRMPPRQKMINLMYIVLTAMLALNVSSDVLDGFTQVHHGIDRTNANMGSRNDALYRQLDDFAAANPAKGARWQRLAQQARAETSELCLYIDSLKHAIVLQADGSDADVQNIRNRENLEAAAVVMLAPAHGKGRQLRRSIESYRDNMTQLLPDSAKRAVLRQVLATDPVPSGTDMPARQWEVANFDHKPTVAAVTMLTKLQNDILYAEGEVLAALFDRIDATDVRVNELNAFVIPRSDIVMRGGEYTADIVLAAVDTTQRPQIYIDGRLMPDTGGRYSIAASRDGKFDLSGYMQVQQGDGTEARLPFSASYTVIEPTATVSATMMNVLYAGIDNPVSISVPGIPTGSVAATMTNGSLSRRGDAWIARPGKIGQEAVVTVTAEIDGRRTSVARQAFRVRRLPDPTAYITCVDRQGNAQHYKGGRPVAKAALLGADGLEAAIDDGLVDTKFTVQGFQTIFFDSMGNAMPENSAGAKFSDRQRKQIQRLSRGKRFYITSIKATGPDGTVRDLSPLEVIIN